MPLSEHEQRQFEAIERALYADDPKFAASVRRRDPLSAGRRRLAGAVGVLVLGLAVLLLGVVAGRWYVGVVGFLIMVGGALLGAYAVRTMTGRAPGRTPTRGRGPAAATAPGNVTHITDRRRRRADHPRTPRAGLRSRARRTPDSGGLKARLEERWHRRMDGQGF